MAQHKYFEPLKSISHTRVIQLRQVQDNFCDDLPALNCLECHLCGKPVGSKRPIGIGWGKDQFQEQMQGIRLCHDCYCLTTEGHQVDIAREERIAALGELATEPPAYDEDYGYPGDPSEYGSST